MQTLRNRVAGIVLVVLIAGMIAAVPWLRRLWQEAPPNLADIAGRDEIAQITGVGVGQRAGSGSGAEGSSPAAPSVEAILAFRGQVVRPGGEPAGGARVRATCTEDGTVGETVADPGGLFELPADDCLYVLEAAREGFGPAIVAGVRPGPASIRLVLIAGREVTGAITLNDVPVGGAAVHMGGPGLWPQRVAFADAAGLYRIAGVKPGRFELVVTTPGAGSGFSIPVVIDDPNPSTPVRVDIGLQASPEITLDVVDRVSGEPVELGVLSISDGPLHVLSLQEEVAGGPIVVDYLPPGDYFGRVRAPGYLPWEGPLRISTANRSARIELSRGGTAVGRVVDEAGNGVSGVRITAFVETEAGGRWEMRRNLFDEFHRLVRPNGTPFWTLDTGYVTDADGQFLVTGLPPGRAVLQASRGGFATASSAPFLVQRDGTYEDLRIVLSAGRRVRGRVENAAGAGVSEAWVSFRDPATPEWAGGDAVSTDVTGGFLLEDVGSAARISVRHAEFSSAAIDVQVPAGGLDDLVIRLSGEARPELRGRVFTARGAPAFGARVWAMRGQSEIPACRAAVGFDGWFVASNCTATPERILIAHPDHAALVADLGGALEPRDWTLTTGGELEIVTQRQPLVVRVERVLPLPAPIWSPATVEVDRWSRHRLQRLTAGEYRVTCQAAGYQDAVVLVAVAEGARAEAVCPYMFQRTTMELYVVDSTGAPVAGAVVLIDGDGPVVREQSDATGAVRWQAEPGRRLQAEALHERWGRGTANLTVPHGAVVSPPRIVLEQSIGGAEPDAFLATLQQWGVAAVADGRAIVVDRTVPASPAANSGMRRGDLLLWARPITDFRFAIGARRGSELMTFELLREPPAPAQ